MKTLIVITLLALAPAGAMAGGIPAADAGPKAVLDSNFAAQFATNATVEATCTKIQPRCRNGRR